MSFPTTNWIKLAEATLNGGEAARDALGWACEKYYGPVELVLRQRGIPEERVEDVRQDFFFDLMKRGFFRRAKRGHGKFRNFLMGALKNFLVNDRRKLMAVKRGATLQRVEMRADIASESSDELQFDLAWAETLFDSALGVVGKEVEGRKGSAGWELLQAFLSGDSQTMGYPELGMALGMSEGAAKTEVSRMRAKFRDQLRAEIWRTVSAPHEVDEEFTYLCRVMKQAWGAGDA